MIWDPKEPKKQTGSKTRKSITAAKGKKKAKKGKKKSVIVNNVLVEEWDIS